VTKAPAWHLAFVGTGARPGGGRGARLASRPGPAVPLAGHLANGNAHFALSAARERRHGQGSSVTTSDDELLDQNELLDQAVKVASDAGADLSGYVFAPVDGATQATVWKGASPCEASVDVALRLTPKPVELITRIAAVIDGASAVIDGASEGSCSLDAADGQKLSRSGWAA